MGCQCSYALSCYCKAFWFQGSGALLASLRFLEKEGGVGVLMGIQEMRDKEWPSGPQVWEFLVIHICSVSNRLSPSCLEFTSLSTPLLAAINHAHPGLFLKLLCLIGSAMLDSGSLMTLSPSWPLLCIMALRCICSGSVSSAC